MNQRISNKITHLYFVMAILILNLHSAYMYLFETSDIAMIINQVVKIICNMSVPTFFFISALLFYRNCENKQYKNVVLGKLKTLIIPYVCWNIICFPLKEIKNVLTNGDVSTSSVGEAIWNILMSEYDPVLWFIRILFIYFLAYPIMLAIVKKPAICFSTILVLFFINIYIGPTTGYSSIRYWLPIYMLGAYLGYWKNDEFFKKTSKSKDTHISIAIFILIGLIAFAYVSDYGMYICRMISPLCYWKIGDIFLTDKSPYWIEKQSFFIYCIQMIFSVFAQKIWILTFGNQPLSAIFSNIGIPIMLLFIIAIVAYLFYKIAPKFYGFLTGGRNA